MHTASAVTQALRAQARPERARLQRRFFRTGPGEYGEGDRFLGTGVPAVRAIARAAKALEENELAKLLVSPWHEARLAAAIVLAERAKRLKDPKSQAALARFYWRHRVGLNNWDLVDVSAEHVLGRWLAGLDEDAAIRWLKRTARHRRLWDRRLAVLATFHLIRLERLRPALVVCEGLLTDEEDLIHKATGWMLREVGKRDLKALDGFLKKHAGRMPRTMLRYALEKKSPEERRRWMNVKKTR